MYFGFRRKFFVTLPFVVALIVAPWSMAGVVGLAWAGTMLTLNAISAHAVSGATAVFKSLLCVLDFGLMAEGAGEAGYHGPAFLIAGIALIVVSVLTTLKAKSVKWALIGVATFVALIILL